MIKKSCLHVEVGLVSHNLKANANLICGWSLSFIPLLVDEGFLYVDNNGEAVKLFVKKKI